MWFDPGGTLGWAWLVADVRAFSRPEHHWEDYMVSWDCGEISGPETEVLTGAIRLIDELLGCVSYLRCAIGGEDFDKTNTPGSKENIFSPVRQNAVLDWECAKRGIKYQYQSRQIRTNVTRDRLKLWGFDGPFKKDEFAAMQHGVTHIRRLKKFSMANPWKLDTPDIINGGGWDCSCSRGRKCNLTHP